MTRAVLCLSLLAIPCSLAAQPFDQKKLIAAVELPAIKVVYGGSGQGCPGKDFIFDDPRSMAQEAEGLEKRLATESVTAARSRLIERIIVLRGQLSGAAAVKEWHQRLAKEWEPLTGSGKADEAAIYAYLDASWKVLPLAEYRQLVQGLAGQYSHSRQLRRARLHLARVDGGPPAAEELLQRELRDHPDDLHNWEWRGAQLIQKLNLAYADGAPSVFQASTDKNLDTPLAPARGQVLQDLNDCISRIDALALPGDSQPMMLRIAAVLTLGGVLRQGQAIDARASKYLTRWLAEARAQFARDAAAHSDEADRAAARLSILWALGQVSAYLSPRERVMPSAATLAREPTLLAAEAEALRLLERMSPNSAVGTLCLVAMQRANREEWQPARAMVQLMQQRDPAHPMVIDLGMVVYRNDEEDQAQMEALVRASLQAQDAPRTRLALCKTLEFRKQWPAARQEIEELAKRYPDYAGARFARVVLLIREGTPAAWKQAEQVLADIEARAKPTTAEAAKASDIDVGEELLFYRSLLAGLRAM